MQALFTVFINWMKKISLIVPVKNLREHLLFEIKDPFRLRICFWQQVARPFWEADKQNVKAYQSKVFESSSILLGNTEVRRSKPSTVDLFNPLTEQKKQGILWATH